MNEDKIHKPLVLRLIVICGFFVFSTVFITHRLATLHISDKHFLQSQGDARSNRVLPINTYRGMILDRNGEFLAISTPVKSLWVNPSQTDLSHPKWAKVAKILKTSQNKLINKIKTKKSKKFLYLKRHLPPNLAEKIKLLNIAGLHLQTEYRRFYPTGEVAAHVLGTTGVDHVGQEGLELAFNSILEGKSGSQHVIKDRMGSIVERLGSKISPKTGQDIVLSLDSRIQYLAYTELLKAQKKHKAKAGSIVILDVVTGEVLAMVNVPSYNPNLPIAKITDSLRNRAVTDQFEPGSVIKPFSVLYALQNGEYNPNSKLDTSPGWMRVGDKIVRDIKNFGELSVSQIVKKSSNVGVAKLVLSLPANGLYNTLELVGFGQKTASDFPGESDGKIVEFGRKDKFSLATLAFGYGITVTPLQLAKSYAILASGGIQRPISFIKQSKNLDNELRVMQESKVQAVTKMLGMTTTRGGTASRAKVTGFNVAGKTGTARKVTKTGYSSTKHVAIFAGFAPIEDPKIAIAIVIDEPKGNYYGGQVAAPIFSNIMSGALRILDIN